MMAFNWDYELLARHIKVVRDNIKIRKPDEVPMKESKSLQGTEKVRVMLEPLSQSSSKQMTNRFS